MDISGLNSQNEDWGIVSKEPPKDILKINKRG